MINTINSIGRYMTVAGGMPPVTYINTSLGNLSVGHMRFNPSQQRIEVYDGNYWIELNMSNVSVALTPDAEVAMDWTIKRMKEESELAKLAETNPTIADLVEQKKNLDNQIKMVQILIKEEPKLGTS